MYEIGCTVFGRNVVKNKIEAKERKIRISFIQQKKLNQAKKDEMEHNNVATNDTNRKTKKQKNNRRRKEGKNEEKRRNPFYKRNERTFSVLSTFLVLVLGVAVVCRFVHSLVRARAHAHTRSLSVVLVPASIHTFAL